MQWENGPHLDKLLHLGVSQDELTHVAGVSHDLLHQRIVHELPQHVRIPQQFPLHVLLQLHEVVGAKPQTVEAGQAADGPQTKRCGSDICYTSHCSTIHYNTE